MPRLVISLATRNRPEQLLDTITRSVANLVLPNTLMQVQVDDDDKPTLRALTWAKPDNRVDIRVAPRPDTIAAKWNRALSEAADVYLVAADDDPYITPGYDAKILEAATLFPDGIGMVYGHMANASFSGVVAPTAKFCEKLGHIFPEYFPYWFVDHWTDDVAKIIDRISFADVRTDQSKTPGTQEMREPSWWATWFDAAYLMRRKIAQEIICASDFQSDPDHKNRLTRHHPLIEWRSRWINDNVRATGPQYAARSNLNPQDPRYQRVKQNAIAMLPHLLDDFGMEAPERLAFRNALIPPMQVENLPIAVGHM